MTSLYEISSKYQAILAKIDECEFISPELLQELESVDEDIQEKYKSTAGFILNLEQHRDGIAKAIINMEDRLKSANNKIEWVRNYLKESMEKCNINEITTPYFDIKIKQNPCKVDVLDAMAIPKDYYREKISYELDKKRIAQQLKENIEIPGVMLIKTKRIEIK